MSVRLPSFRLKLATIAAAAAATDLLCWRVRGAGLNLALVALAWTAALTLANPAARRDPLARAALAAAALLALLQAERPTPIGLLLYVLAMGVAALAPRAGRGEDAWRWAQRLAAGAVLPIAGPFIDLHLLRRVRRRGPGRRISAVIAASALPVVGGLVFLGLFATANPVISDALSRLRLGAPDLARMVFWAMAAFPLWVVLRPRGLRRTFAPPGLEGETRLPGSGPVSIVVSLALFNLIFGVQNGLDVAYLWAGAGLPHGVSFADYAHRGAYPLIATAILAGLFVLVFLRPGSATAADRRVRALVIVWVAQNLFLVASTALRTVDYIDAYSLTRLRIAALLWMALVATGLILILWRMLAGRTSSWLINANAAAAGLVLAACSVVDLGSFAAAWNVAHAREVGGRGVSLDLCYLTDLGGASLLPLTRLERRDGLAPEFRDRVRYVRRRLQVKVAMGAGDWRTFRWRDARRLNRVRDLTGEATTWPGGPPRNCRGDIVPPPSPPPSRPAPPLTPAPNPGT